MLGSQLIACEHMNVTAKSLCAGALFADVFAFTRRKITQKSLKVGIVFIMPVKILVLNQQKKGQMALIQNIQR